MKEYTVVKLRERPQLLGAASLWFHQKWGIPQAVYAASMADCLQSGGIPQWYLVLDGDTLVAGAGVIANDFHLRRDLSPMSAPSMWSRTTEAGASPAGCSASSAKIAGSWAFRPPTWSRTTLPFMNGMAGASSVWCKKKGAGKPGCMCTMPAGRPFPGRRALPEIIPFGRVWLEDGELAVV